MTHLYALDPHDEPAHVAGHLGDDVESHHEVVMGADKQDGQHQRDCGQHHAHAVNPSPPETICKASKICNCTLKMYEHEFLLTHEKLSDEY